MAAGPQAPRTRIPHTPLQESRDAYSPTALVAGRHWLVERIQVNGIGNFGSAVTIPANMRAVVTAWGLEYAAALSGALGLGLEVTVAGNAYLGTSDKSIGTFDPQGQFFNASGGTPPQTVPNVFPDGAQVVTSEGSGSMWQVNVVSLTLPDVVDVAVWYHLIHADTLGCTSAP